MTPKRRAWTRANDRERAQRPERQEQQRAAALRYTKSPKGQAALSAYRRTPKGREIGVSRVTKRRRLLAGRRCDLTLEQWNQILRGFDFACAHCGRSDVALERDHLVPLARGGEHTKDNIVPACRTCNVRKGDTLLSP